MAFDDKRRFLAGRCGVIGIVRRKEIGVRRQAVLGRKGEVLRRRDVAAQFVLDQSGGGAAQHLRGAGRRIDQHDRRRVGRRTGAAHDAVADSADLAKIRIGKIDRRQLAGGDVEPCETVMPSLGIGADKLRRRQKGVGRLREIPLRLTEFSIARTERVHRAAAIRIAAVQIPPAAAVGDKIQHAIGRPLRLKDRLAVAARDAPRGGEASIGGDVGLP